MKQAVFHDAKSLDDHALEGDHFALLRVINRKGASFPSEISTETGFSEYNIKSSMYTLKENDLVEAIIPNLFEPQIELLRRVPEMSAKGQGGYPAFCQKRWFKLTSKGRNIANKVEV